MRGGVLGVVRPALFAPHVVDEEHLGGPAGVHAGSVPTLVLQLVSVQRHLPVVRSRKGLLSPDQRNRGCLDARHRPTSDSSDLGQHVTKLTVGENDSGQRLVQLGQVLHRSFRSLSENCNSKPATLDQQSDAATLATLILTVWSGPASANPSYGPG